MSTQRRKVVVVGGAGFLGQNLIQELEKKSQYEVVSFDLRQSKALDVKQIQGDISKYDQVQKALEGAYIVFHTATLAPTSANALNPALMQKVNVDGTKNVVQACLENGVNILIYTSSSSVVFGGFHIKHGNETLPYAKALDFYTDTKIQGEKAALEAVQNLQNNSSNSFKNIVDKPTLQVIALRPSGIFGPGDQFTIPTFVDNARRGLTKYQLGEGKAKMDFTYVANVVDAHILAAEALQKPNNLSGEAYFITNDEPISFWDFLRFILKALDYDYPRI